MIRFALRFGGFEGAFNRKHVLNRCLEQAANIPRIHWISTVNNARLWYLKPLHLYQTEKPYHINLPANALGSHAQSNEVSEEYAGIKIQDLRGLEKDFTLDRNGFQIIQDASRGAESSFTHNASAAPTSDIFDDTDTVRKYYYPAVERLLKDKLKVQSAKAFTHDVCLPPSKTMNIS